MGKCVLAAFPYTLSGARGRSPNDMNAFYCSPWAETPTGGQNPVWLRPSGRLGISITNMKQSPSLARHPGDTKWDLHLIN